MKLTITHVSIDGVVQGLGASNEDRRNDFDRGDWALPLVVDDRIRSIDHTHRSKVAEHNKSSPPTSGPPSQT